MKDHGLLVPGAEPHRLAIVIVTAHQGGGTVAFTYREEWPHADAVRFAINYLRMFAKDSAERIPRPPRRRRRASRQQVRARQMPADPSVRFTRKGLAVRQRIVDTTAELMFERGVAGTSLEDVRGSAGVSGSQLTHYFADKRDLTRQVIALRRNDMREFHTQQQFGALDSVDALQAWANACVAEVDSVYRRGGCVYGSLAGELLEADDQIHDDLAAGYDQWIKLFHAGLLAMRRRGDLRAEADPRHLAVALVTAHQGGAMLTYATGSAEPLNVAVNAAIDYVRSFTPRHKRTT
jgi:AcrR family transcriptional regulator